MHKNLLTQYVYFNIKRVFLKARTNYIELYRIFSE